MGKTFRLGSAIWTNINTHLISHLKTAFSSITSGVREVLGPVAEAFDAMKNIIVGVFGFTKGLFASIFGGKVKPEDKVRNRFLQEIVKYFKDEKKKDARAAGGKKKLPKPLAMLLLGLGIVIGAVVGAIMAPFRLLLGALKKIKPIAFAITKFFGEASKFGKIIAKAGKFLGPLAAGFKIGFKVLGWPLTILLGVIDAIRGYFKSKEMGATTGEAIVAGIKAAFMGFIGSFIDIFGWVFEKILGIVGIEVKGTADKIKNFFSEFFDLFISGLKMIWGLVISPVKSIISLFKKDMDGMTTEGANELFPGNVLNDNKLKQAEEERQRLEKKKIEDAKLLEQNKQTTAAINQVNQTTINNQTTVEQIPDELDGSLVGLELLWDF